MKNILPLFFSLMLLLSAVPVLAEKGPAIIEMAGKSQPKVTFNHGTHQTRITDCKACHHMGVGNGSCNGCHGRDSRFPDATTAIHASCNGCHKEQSVAGSDACAFCHVAATTTGGGGRRSRR